MKTGKTRVLTVILSMALLLCAVGAVGGLSSAATVADCVTGGTVTVLTAQNLPKAEDNLLRGLAPNVLTDGLYQGINQTVNYRKDADGNYLFTKPATPANSWIQTDADDTRVTKMVTNSTAPGWPKYAEFAYDLGAKGTINSISVGSTAEPTTPRQTVVESQIAAGTFSDTPSGVQPWLYLHRGAFYVSDKMDTLFSSQNKVSWDFIPTYSGSGSINGVTTLCPQAMQVTLTTPAEGRYVGFRLEVPAEDTGWGTLVRVSELGVFGTCEKPAGVSVTRELLDTVNDKSRIPTGNNRLAECAPIKVSGEAYPGVTNLSQATDGILYGVTAGLPPRGTDNKVEYGSKDDPAVPIIFDLGDELTVKKVLVAASGVDEIKYRPDNIKVYVGNSRSTLFDSNPAFTVTLTGSIGSVITVNDKLSGRYIGFDAEGDPDYHRVRFGELGVWGDFGEDTNLSVTPAILNSTDDATKIPTGTNLLKGLLPMLSNGMAYPNAVNPDQATDGVLYGVTEALPAKGIDNKIELGSVSDPAKPIIFDLRGNVTVKQVLVAASGVDNAKYRPDNILVYIGNDRANLFSGKAAFSIKTDGAIGAVVTINDQISGRYIGLMADGDPDYKRVRYGELGVWGEYDSAGKMPDAINLILDETGGDRHLVDSYVTETANLSNIVDHDVSCNEPFSNWTDGDLNNRGVAYNRYGQHLVNNRDYICAATPWTVFIYHLGGTASVEEIRVVSSDEPNYHIAGVRFYVGQTLATLFDDSNKVMDTNGEATLADGSLDPAKDCSSTSNRFLNCNIPGGKEGRYAAIVITRPHPVATKGYSIARISEIQVMGSLLEAEVAPNTLFTDKASGVSVDISQLNYDDIEFFDTVGSLKVETRDIPAGMNTSIDNGWLCTDSKLYKLTLLDKSGTAISDATLNGRELTVYIPSKTPYAQLIGVIKNNQPERLINSRVLDGTAWANAGSGNGREFVMLKFTPLPDTEHTITVDPLDAVR